MHFGAQVRLDDADVHRLENGVADLHLRCGDVRAHTWTLGVSLTRQIHLVARAALRGSHEAVLQQERQPVTCVVIAAARGLGEITVYDKKNRVIRTARWTAA